MTTEAGGDDVDANVPEPCISRSVVEILDVEYAAELAQYLIAGAPVLIDLGPRLGCACSGAVSGVTASQARGRGGRDRAAAVADARRRTGRECRCRSRSRGRRFAGHPRGRPGVGARTRYATVDRTTENTIITVILIATMGTAGCPS